jgi:outer membrane immunogenic protein
LASAIFDDAMNRRDLAALGLIALAAVQPAFAADAPVYKASPPAAVAIFNWSGFYIGVNGGYGRHHGQSVELLTDDVTPTNFGDATAPSRGTIGDIKGRGWFAGGQVGYNWQYRPSWLVGIEADLQYSRISDAISGQFTNPNGTFPISGAANFDIRWFGTLRGRLGAVANRWLIYATAGLAYGNVGYNLFAFETGFLSLFQSQLSQRDTKLGYVVGGGLERAFGARVTMKVEYQYVALGSISATAPVTPLGGGAPTGETATLRAIRANFHAVRAGLNWKL